MIRVMPGGLCHAHGPFKAPLTCCPQWPKCTELPANPFFREAGEWFTSYDKTLERARDVVIKEAKRMVVMGFTDFVHLKDAVNSLISLEEENERYERLAGWD